jgi:hypothetical protein
MPNPRGHRQAAALIPCALAAAALLASGALVSRARAQDAGTARSLEACRAIADAAARLRCFENATSKLGATPPPASPSPPQRRDSPSPAAPTGDALGDWHLLRTANPAGGDAIVSVIHTGDLAKSDLDFAGLMIRCGKGAAPEVLVVLITPFPPNAHPKVTIGAPGHGTTLEGQVVPPGVSLLLPAEATVLANGPWQSLGELAIEVSDRGNAVHGTVPVQGLAGALVTLAANCPAK